MKNSLIAHVFLTSRVSALHHFLRKNMERSSIAILHIVYTSTQRSWSSVQLEKKLGAARPQWTDEFHRNPISWKSRTPKDAIFHQLQNIRRHYLGVHLWCSVEALNVLEDFH